MSVLSTTLSCLLAAVFLLSGGRKIPGGPGVSAAAARLGMPAVGYRAIGAAEVAGAAGLLAGLAWTPLGIAASAAFVLLMIGAVAAHLRAGDRPGRWAPAATLALLAAAALVLVTASA